MDWESWYNEKTLHVPLASSHRILQIKRWHFSLQLPHRIVFFHLDRLWFVSLLTQCRDQSKEKEVQALLLKIIMASVVLLSPDLPGNENSQAIIARVHPTQAYFPQWSRINKGCQSFILAWYSPWDFEVFRPQLFILCSWKSRPIAAKDLIQSILNRVSLRINNNSNQSRHIRLFFNWTDSP